MTIGDISRRQYQESFPNTKEAVDLAVKLTVSSICSYTGTDVDKANITVLADGSTIKTLIIRCDNVKQTRAEINAICSDVEFGTVITIVLTNLNMNGKKSNTYLHYLFDKNDAFSIYGLDLMIREKLDSI